MSNVQRFQCPICKRLFSIDFDKSPRQKDNIDADGNFYQICGQTNKVEKCKPIK